MVRLGVSKSKFFNADKDLGAGMVSYEEGFVLMIRYWRRHWPFSIKR